MAKKQAKVAESIFDEPQPRVPEAGTYVEHAGLRTLVTPILQEICEKNQQRLTEIGGYNPHGYAYDKHGNKL